MRFHVLFNRDVRSSALGQVDVDVDVDVEQCLPRQQWAHQAKEGHMEDGDPDEMDRGPDQQQGSGSAKLEVYAKPRFLPRPLEPREEGLSSTC
jgi:hypothetical protein